MRRFSNKALIFLFVCILQAGNIFSWSSTSVLAATPEDGLSMNAQVIDINDLKLSSGNGSDSSYMVRSGLVYAWGSNAAGELGLGDNSSRDVPTVIPRLTGAKEVLGGRLDAFALMEDGTVKAWGYNYFGALGLGDKNDRNIPTTVPGLTGVKQIAVGYQFALALLSDGTVKAWGVNSAGQLGLGDNIDRTTPTVVPGLTDVKQLVAGNSHALAILSDGTVKAWGMNDGNLGLGDKTDRTTPTVVPGLTNVKQLVAGTYFTLALHTDGKVEAFGSGYNLGLGDKTDRTTPTVVPSLTGVTQLAAADQHALALLSDGTVKVWGQNQYGELGLGNTDLWVFTPTTIPGLTNVTEIAAGEYHSLAELSDGSLRAWGANFKNQLGIGNTSLQLTPTVVSGLEGVIQVATPRSNFGSHLLALLSDGSVKAWGSNNHGQLGLGDTTNRNTPTLIPGLTGIKQIVAGKQFTLALLSDGTVKAWGENTRGQLGLGDTTDRKTPTLVSGLTDVKQLAAGDDFALALLSDGTIKAWGYGKTLGLGDNTDRNTPTSVPGLTNVKQIDSLYQHSFAVLTDGTVKAWGGGDDSTEYPSTTPTVVPNLSGVIQISTGFKYNLALLTDGTVKAWGSNDSGQLGLGDTTDRTTPTVIPGLTGVTQVLASEGYYSMAILSDGTVKAWGNNASGNLGLGDAISRVSPTVVPDLKGIKQITNGSSSLALQTDGTVERWGNQISGSVNRDTPTKIVGEYHPRVIFLQVSIYDQNQDNVLVEYYLDDQQESSKQESVTLVNGAATTNIELDKSKLSVGLHTVRVVASNSSQMLTQTASFEIGGAPSAPQNLNLIGKTTSTVDLSWISTDKDITGYNIYVNNELVGTSEVTMFTVTGLVRGVPYNFTVRAFNGDGNLSEASNTLTITLPKPSRIKYIYDSAGRLDSIELPSGEIKDYVYDRNGNLIKIITR